MSGKWNNIENTTRVQPWHTYNVLREKIKKIKLSANDKTIQTPDGFLLYPCSKSPGRSPCEAELMNNSKKIFFLNIMINFDEVQTWEN